MSIVNNFDRITYRVALFLTITDLDEREKKTLKSLKQHENSLATESDTKDSL